MKSMLDTMLCLAVMGHAGQYDRGGNPYILHPLKVMHYTKSNDVEIQCIALGHDLVEDTKTLSHDECYQQLREAGMSERVIEGIRCLTKLPGETDAEYLAKVKSNRDAVIVKLADLQDNRDIGRLVNQQDSTDIRRLADIFKKNLICMAKYHAMYQELERHLMEQTWVNNKPA